MKSLFYKHTFTRDLSRWLSVAVLLHAAFLSEGSSQLAPGLERGQNDLLSSNEELFINPFVGADRYYNAGLHGGNVIMANVEAGHLWNGHNSLSHSNVQFTGQGASGAFDAHATRVASAMGGNDPNFPELSRGIAYGATLWSGALATDWLGERYATSFDVDTSSLSSVYREIMLTGNGGQTPQVVNSSWGFGGSGVSSGHQLWQAGIDGLVSQSNTVFVASAGNAGPGDNTVRGFGAAYNVIAVGALSSDSSSPPYDSVANFSSRGPSDGRTYSNGQWTVEENVRASVDIVAPGSNLTLAHYGGGTGGNDPALDGSSPWPVETHPNAYITGRQGTSYSAPIVAGGAALVTDAALTHFSGDPGAADPRVVKSILLNSADKLPGWDNGQTVNADGVITTDQSLDWAMGAGAMNLEQAFNQQMSLSLGGRAVTTGVPGTPQGDQGLVGNVGWDFGEVGFETGNLYFLEEPSRPGDIFTITLSWFIDRDHGGENFQAASEVRFANLDLNVFLFDNPNDRNILETYAQSVSVFNNVEHLHLALGPTAYFGFEVAYTDDMWNFHPSILDTVEYGVAWALIPEPSSTLLVLLWGVGYLIMLRHRRRRAGK